MLATRIASVSSTTNGVPAAPSSSRTARASSVSSLATAGPPAQSGAIRITTRPYASASSASEPGRAETSSSRITVVRVEAGWPAASASSSRASRDGTLASDPDAAATHGPRIGCCSVCPPTRRVGLSMISCCSASTWYDSSVGWAANASTSAAGGGMPVRSNHTRRTRSRGLAAGDGGAPAAVAAERIKRSIRE